MEWWNGGKKPESVASRLNDYGVALIGFFIIPIFQYSIIPNLNCGFYEAHTQLQHYRSH